MTEQEREDLQCQAEILDRIDGLQAAATRKQRLTGGTVGGLLVAAVAVLLWVGPTPSSQPTSLEGRLVADASTVAEGQESLPALLTTEAGMRSDGAQRQSGQRLAAEASPLAQPSVEAPRVAMAERLGEAPSPAENSPAELRTAVEPVVAVAERPSASDSPCDNLEAGTAPNSPNPTAYAPQPRTFYASKRHRVKDFFAFGNDPNMDGANFSINLL